MSFNNCAAKTIKHHLIVKLSFYSLQCIGLQSILSWIYLSTCKTNVKERICIIKADLTDYHTNKIMKNRSVCVHIGGPFLPHFFNIFKRHTIFFYSFNLYTGILSDMTMENVGFIPQITTNKTNPLVIKFICEKFKF